MIANIISIIVFFILVLMAVRIMANKPVLMKVPWVKENRKESVSNFQQFLLLTLASSMIMTGLDLRGLDLAAIRLLIWIVFGLVIIVMTGRASPIHYKAPIILYSLLIVWLVIKTFDSPFPDVGVRVLLKYLYPFVVLIIFARLVRTENFILIMLKFMAVSAVIYSLFAHGFVTTYLPAVAFQVFGKVLWQVAPFNDYAAIMIAVFFGIYWLTRKNIYLFLIVWFVLSSVFMVVRIGLASGFLALVAVAFFRYPVRVIPFAMISGLLIFLILNTTNFKNKMFYDPSYVNTDTYTTTISHFDQETINSSGRFEMWDWALQTYYEKRPIDGTGLGNLQEVFYSQKHPFAPIRIVHNDFVQMLCDTGIISVVLYLLTMFSGIAYGFKNAFNYRNSPVVRVLGAITVSSFLAILLSMNFDNVVNYSFPAHSLPYAFLGALIGVNSAPAKKTVKTYAQIFGVPSARPE